MGLLTFFGGGLVAFSPVVALLGLQVARSPRRVILAIGSAFAWMLGLYFAALWWFVIPPLRTIWPWTVLWAVAWQEAARVGFLLLFLKGERGMSALAAPPPEERSSSSSSRRRSSAAASSSSSSSSAAAAAATGAGVGAAAGDAADAGDNDDGVADTIVVEAAASALGSATRWRAPQRRAPRAETVQTALAFGAGTGLSHGLLLFGTPWWQAASGPAVLFSCPAEEGGMPQYNGIAVGAVVAMCWTLNHVFWYIPALHAVKRDGATTTAATGTAAAGAGAATAPPGVSKPGLAFIAGLHLLASLVTLVSLGPGGCVPSILLTFVCTALSAAAAFLTVYPQRTPVRLRAAVDLLLLGK